MFILIRISHIFGNFYDKDKSWLYTKYFCRIKKNIVKIEVKIVKIISFLTCNFL